MITKLSPQFLQLCDQLRAIPWFSACGLRDSIALQLPISCRIIKDAAVACKAIEDPSWEGWTLDRRNDLTSFLGRRFPKRDAEWGQVATAVRGLIESEIVPKIAPLLAVVLPGAPTAIDSVRWDLANALMEAAYADCRPPQFFTHLIPVYGAGHLPVGWDESTDGGTLLVY